VLHFAPRFLTQPLVPQREQMAANQPDGHLSHVG
jgi:hypothetical protein